MTRRLLKNRLYKTMQWCRQACAPTDVPGNRHNLYPLSTEFTLLCSFSALFTQLRWFSLLRPPTRALSPPRQKNLPWLIRGLSLTAVVCLCDSGKIYKCWCLDDRIIPLHHVCSRQSVSPKVNPLLGQNADISQAITTRLLTLTQTPRWLLEGKRRVSIKPYVQKEFFANNAW